MAGVNQIPRLDVYGAYEPGVQDGQVGGAAPFQPVGAIPPSTGRGGARGTHDLTSREVSHQKAKRAMMMYGEQVPDADLPPMGQGAPRPDLMGPSANVAGAGPEPGALEALLRRAGEFFTKGSKGNIDDARADGYANDLVVPAADGMSSFEHGHDTRMLTPLELAKKFPNRPDGGSNVDEAAAGANRKGAGGGTGRGRDGKNLTEPGSTDTANFDGGDSELDNVKALIQKFQNEGGQIDLRPLLALTDAWTGSHLAAGYQAPMSDDERQVKALGMQQHLLEHEADLKHKREYLAMLGGFKARAADQADERLDISRGKAGGKGKDPEKASEAALNKSFSKYKPALTQIAAMSLPHGSDPKSASKFLPDLDLQARDYAKHLVAKGRAANLEEGYALAVKAMAASAAGPDGNQQ